MHLEKGAVDLHSHVSTALTQQRVALVRLCGMIDHVNGRQHVQLHPYRVADSQCGERGGDGGRRIG